jgi:Bacterial Ig-like domain (group 3)/MBG domain (YGX type)
VANYFDHLALVETNTVDRSQNRGRVRKVSALQLLLLLLLLCVNVAAIAQVNIYNRSYDLGRTGANLQETVLTPANVNSNTFGKLFTVHTDGEVYAQPLYVSNLAIAGGTHNVVFVASMRNTVYAIDADNGTVYWTQNFGTPITPQNLQWDQNISWSTGLGILSTPVIDPTTNIMYFVSANQSVVNGNLVYTDHLNALEIATGAAAKSPVNITATYSTPDLTNPLQLVIQRQNQRPALTIANGNIYIIFGSHDDITPYEGWVLAYNKTTLQQVAVYVTTTIGSEGGIWMAGQGPAVDSAGNLYLLTGNGSSGKTPNGLVQTGESMIKLSPSLQLLDYFTPYNASSLTAGDMDLASAGLILIPNTNYVLGGGKEGVLYLTNTNDLGGFNASSDQVRQEFQAIYGVGTSHIHGSPSYFDSDVNGPTVYVWGENDVLRSFFFNSTTGYLNTTPWATSTMTAPATNNDGAMPGGFTSISANGNTNGILWASTPYNGDAAHQLDQGVLYAFDANTLKLLWSDKFNDGRDEIGTFSKFCPPIVANGKMYVPNFGPVGVTDGSGDLVVYGLLEPELTVNVNNASMAAGSALPALTGNVSGLQNGDTLGGTIIVTYSTTANSSSPAGTYPITATVTGSSAKNYQVVVIAGTLTITAPTTPTTTSLSAPGSATYGANVTLTATVTSTAGTPGGSVLFYSGRTALGAGTLNAGGMASLTTNTLAAGTDNLTATYEGAGSFTGSTSLASSITINPATQTITFAPIGSHAYGSAPFAVSATSSAGSNYPVTITVQSGPAVINGGTVTITGVGTVVLQGAQVGNADYNAATSTQSFQATPVPLTVTANNASRAYGAANPAFSGTVTGAVGSDSFTESFTTTATNTSNVGGYPIVPSVTGTNLNDYTVTIVNGTLTVNGAATTTTLSGPGTAVYGANVTLTATVTSPGGTPTGTVTFYNGAVALGTGTLNSSGVATLGTTTLASGSDQVTASYSAVGNFAASTSTTTTVTVNAATQTISFPAIASRAYGSAPFTVTATSSAGSNYPVTIAVQSGPAVISGGTVTVTGAGTVVLLASQAGDSNYSAATATQSFQVMPAVLTATANNASRIYGAANPAFSGTVTGAVGSDSFSESFTTTATTTSNAGSYPIVPAVTGSQLSNYTVTVVNGALTVNGAATTTTLSAPGSAAYGAGVTLTATVASTAGMPGGIVTFYSGSTSVGTGTLNGGGVATLTTTTLPVGTDTLTASYGAAGNFAASTSPSSSITVNVASQTISFPAIAAHAYGSAPFAVTASSNLGSSYPVTITVQSGPAVISGGIVTVTGVGTVVLQATQAGNTEYNPATATQSFQVIPAALTVAANNATRSYGAANPAFSGSVSGGVGSDSFTESFTTTATTTSNVGSYAIVPSVTGAQLANYTVTAVPGELTVNGAATTTKLNAPVNTAYGASVTLTATVTSTAGVPAGSVTFYSGSTSLGVAALNSSGVATLSTTTLPAGTDTTIATYVAAGNFAGSSSSGVTLTVIGGPGGPGGTYTLVANPSTLTIAPGATGKTTLIFTPTNGYSGTVALSCSNLPASVSCAFDQTQVTLSGNNQNISTGLTINTATQQAGKHVPSQTPQSPFSPALFALVFWCPGGLTGLAVMVRRRKLAGTQRLWHLCLLLAGAWALAAGLSGCGMSGYVVHPTPSTVQLTVVGTGTSGAVVTTQKVTLTVNMTSMTPQ